MKYVYKLFIISILCFVLSVSVSAFGYSHDGTFIFGGYCYYIENGDVYRTPITMLSGEETELFSKNSKKIYLDGSYLVSENNENVIEYISLTGETDSYFVPFSFRGSEDMLLGSLSAKYESNGNPAAISSGNDAGGVSFGAYQFASKSGTPMTFAKWCISTENSIEIGTRLINAYSADSSSYGENFKSEWRAISTEDSSFFLSLQHAFVKSQYYDAIVYRIERDVENFDIEMYGIALKNVFWSRSVQHGVGGAYNVITRAFDTLGGFTLQSEDVLIRAIYAESGAVVDSGTNPMTGQTAQKYGIEGKFMKYYSKNSSAVQLSVYSRLNIRELSDALQMLSDYGGYIASDDTPFELGNIYASEITDASASLFGTIYNYRLADVSEYGFFIGKTLNTLVEIPISKNSVFTPVISFSASTFLYSDELEPMSKYYYGIYAIIDNEYVCSEISSFTTAYATVFTANFENFDGTLLYSVTLRENRTPYYKGKSPLRTADEKYTYSFIGWDKEILPLTDDVTYTAVYEAILNKYTVRYFSADNEVIYEEVVNYGENSVFEGALPQKEPNLQFNYSFKKWSNDGTNITRDLEIHPVWDITDKLWDGSVATNFSAGKGTEYDPYLISSPAELAYLSSYVSGGGNTNGVYFELTENIVLSKLENYKLFTPIGTEENPFSGCFDGKGHKIIGTTVNSTENAGLFGVISGATLQNIIIEDAFISGKNTGVLVGKISASKNGNRTAINNCFLCGKVNAENFGGLAIGYAESNDSIIMNIQTSGSVNASVAGEICGYFGGISISYCYSDALLTAEKYGEFCGQNAEASTIFGCYSSKDEGDFEMLDFVTYWQMKEGKPELKISRNSFTYFVYGDISGDGRLSISDAVILAQYLAGWTLEDINEPTEYADFNGDGKANTLDAVILAQYLAGWSVTLAK